MAELKTKKTNVSVDAFLKAIPDESRRKDCMAISKMMEKVTGSKPKLWGTAIVGFGDLHYVYASGREGDWFRCGFANRKSDITLYFMSGIEHYESYLKKLGKHKTGKGCLYIKRVADIDMDVLESLTIACLAGLEKWIEQMKKNS